MHCASFVTLNCSIAFYWSSRLIKCIIEKAPLDALEVDVSRLKMSDIYMHILTAFQASGKINSDAVDLFYTAKSLIINCNTSLPFIVIDYRYSTFICGKQMSAILRHVTILFGLL